MEIKVGGVYKARNGDREEIVDYVNGTRPYYKGKNGYYWPDGRQDKSDQTAFDLIAEWQDEPAPEVGQWIGWNGGECPVHPETVVECFCSEDKEYYKPEVAGFLDWSTGGAYRIVTPYVEPKKLREFWLCKDDGDMRYSVLDCPSKADWDTVIHVREVLDDG